MNSFKRFLAAALVSTAGFGLFVACGGNNGPADCLVDGDCGDGQACELQVCVDTCEADTDCLEGEVCEVGENTELSVCKAAANNGETNNGENNGTNNGTTVPPTLYYVALVEDQSSGDEACANASNADPGSDIYGALLEDTTGAVLGFGNAVWAEEPATDANDNQDLSILDGAPDTSKDCPGDFSSDTVYSTGCGGQLFFEFLDADGIPVPLDATAGQQIRVLEYGVQCGGSDADEYRVAVCTDTAGAKEGNSASCTLGSCDGASGITTCDVSGF